MKSQAKLVVVKSTHRPVVVEDGPSEAFIRRGRNPAIRPPDRFVPTKKADGDVVISTLAALGIETRRAGTPKSDPVRSMKARPEGERPNGVVQ